MANCGEFLETQGRILLGLCCACIHDVVDALRRTSIFGGSHGIGLGRQVTKVRTAGHSHRAGSDGWVLRHWIATHRCNVCARLYRSNRFRRGDTLDLIGGGTPRIVQNEQRLSLAVHRLHIFGSMRDRDKRAIGVVWDTRRCGWRHWWLSDVVAVDASSSNRHELRHQSLARGICSSASDLA